MRRTLALFFLLMPISAFASDIGDVLGYLSDIYDLQKQTFDVANSQLTDLGSINNLAQNTLNELKGDLTGKFGYGNLSDSELKQYTYSNDDWEDVLSMSNANADFKAAQQRYAELYSTPEKVQGVTSLVQTQYQQGRSISRAALAASSESYNLVAEHMQSVKDILSKLEATDHTVTEKEALDLNARLIAELCFIQLEVLKQQNIQNQITATNSQAGINGQSEQGDFLNWKKTY
jgi:type IV secretion system protein VirB5